MYITPIIPGEHRYPTITPFTIADGQTYLNTLEHLVKMMKDIIDNVNENNEELYTLVVGILNTKINEINDALDDQETSVDQKISTLETLVDTAVQQIINSSIEVQDPVVAGLIEDENTDTYDSLQSTVQQIFNSIEVQDPVVAGLIDDENSETYESLQSTFTPQEHGRVNVLDLGFKGDGATDNSQYVARLMDTIGTIETPEWVYREVYFPAGKYLFSEPLTFWNTVKISGAGRNSTTLVIGENVTDDFITLKGAYSFLSQLSIDGSLATSGEGDGIVVSNAYTHVSEVSVADVRGSAIVYGKNQRSIDWKITDVNVYRAGKYGVHIQETVGSSGQSTDGTAMNLGIGICGLSGVRVDTSSNKFVNVHSWGNGHKYDDQDGAGIYVTRNGNIFVLSQGESNLTSGFVIDHGGHLGTTLAACKAWQNGFNGIHLVNGRRSRFSDLMIFNNGLRNTTDSDSPQFSGIRKDTDVSQLIITGSSFWDSGAAVPTDPLHTVSRFAEQTQNYAISDGDSGAVAAELYVFSGNTMLATDHSKGPFNLVHRQGKVVGCEYGNLRPDVSTASEVVIQSWHEAVFLNGTGTVNNITFTRNGHRVIMWISGTVTFTSSGNLLLSEDLVVTSGDMVEIASFGPVWTVTKL